MQTVSKAWKNVHRQTLLNESYVEVSLDIADPDSLAEATVEDNGSLYISNTPEIVDEIDTPVEPYGTLEQNIWLLNGSRKSIPEMDYIKGGYVGDVLSNEECIFDTKIPTATINFKTVHTKIIPGVTISWGTAYNEYAVHFIVTAYKGSTIMAKKEIIDNKSVTSVVEMDISNYDRITIHILSWCLPHRRARIDEIFVGIRKVYSKADLMSYSHKQIVDPISTSLPKMEIRFSIDNSDDSYNPYNLNGLAKYLTERQEVKTRYGLKMNDGMVEWVKGGSFYLSEWYAKQNGISADFVARDLLEFMSVHYKDDASEYYDTTTGKFKDRSLYDLATQVFMAADLPLTDDGSLRWIIDKSLEDIYTTAPLPDDTLANCLQLIANAAGCVLYPDRDGVFHIEPMSAVSTDYEINKFNSYSKSEITFSKPIKQVVVKKYAYTVGEKEIESSTTEVTSNVGEMGETIIVDNPLITDSPLNIDDRASVVGEWIGNYLKNRMTLKSTVRADVRLDALDIVTHENDYGTNKVCTTDVEFVFNGAFRGTSEGRVI